MPQVLIIYEDLGQIAEIKKIVSGLHGWDETSMALPSDMMTIINRQLKKGEIHFLILSKLLDSNTSKELKFIHSLHPLINIIYYYNSLRNRQFVRLFDAGITSCVIGEKRQSYLKDTLHNLWESHWKRIPDSFYSQSGREVSARGKVILKYIENKPLRDCNVKSLARFMKTSESHFRNEFKEMFNLNFRDFKQKLFSHYESLLLLDEKWKPNEIYKILNYENISNFSRSFKTRHGISYRNMIQNIKQHDDPNG